jgi:hypothetical protein
MDRGLLIILSALLSNPLQAVIVAGANGGAGTTNNTTVAQLNSIVPVAFTNFDNSIQYSDASGTYLGYNASTRDVWVLTANHITTTAAGSSLQIKGVTYLQQGSRISVPNSDLALVRYQNSLGIVPAMPAVSLATGTPTVGSPFVMMGWGADRVQGPSSSANVSDAVSVGGGTGSGYTWRSSSNSMLRWGTNNVSTSLTVALSGLTLTNAFWGAYFDQPAPGQWLTSNEATLAVRDSGGGAFFLIGGKWVLGGVAYGVDTPGSSPFSSPTSRQGSYFTDVGTYNSSIQSLIGTGVTLVPEPSVGLLGLLGLATIRRRRG